MHERNQLISMSLLLLIYFAMMVLVIWCVIVRDSLNRTVNEFYFVFPSFYLQIHDQLWLCALSHAGNGCSDSSRINAVRILHVQPELTTKQSKRHTSIVFQLICKFELTHNCTAPTNEAIGRTSDLCDMQLILVCWYADHRIVYAIHLGRHAWQKIDCM